MRVLTMASQKGGSGKTSLGASLAVAAVEDGETVFAIDTDPQGSLAAWGRRRQAEGITVETADPAKVRQAIGRAKAAGATLAIVDTPGIFGAGVAVALQDADFVLVPVKPSILDVEAARPTVEQLQTLRKPFGLVLNQCLTSSQGRTLDAATALVRSGTLAPCMVALRADFLDAMTAGQGVTELATRGKAAGEVRLLWAWIKGQMTTGTADG
ncbi:ParA family protein [Lichenibacterium ramalinae]|uniref:ParA family protein n=1 Tax=Lichenibacterium ramalinae TaxID=2316527 RepID=A0A4Q2R618_9HYPH|nr:ParA family protein [Lichenibacterium ramalinae]RYB01351.1 ParA family protein [Lichenibacterium ramalinae]